MNKSKVTMLLMTVFIILNVISIQTAETNAYADIDLTEKSIIAEVDTSSASQSDIDKAERIREKIERQMERQIEQSIGLLIQSESNTETLLRRPPHLLSYISAQIKHSMMPTKGTTGHRIGVLFRRSMVLTIY